jgi:ATP-dependent exoDNAse (exonuclease V) beta subunit
MAPDRRRDKSGAAYRLLRTIGEKKRVAEAKRIFYVAATRACRSLYLSGIVRTKNGEIVPRKESPLWWLCNHYGLRQSENEELIAEKNSFLDLHLNPTLTSADVDEHAAAADLPEPLPFEPEALPYTTISPSQLTEKTEQTQKEEDDPNARARGAVTHKILEHLGQDRPLPETAAVVAALVSEGVLETEAKPLAEEILQEIQHCLQEQFFGWLISKDHPRAYCEWSLEDRPAENQISTGIMDRVVFDGDSWWVVDYKTSRPLSGESVDRFIEHEVNRYRPQLLAYREMIADYFKVDPRSVRVVLYFTSLQRKIELNAESQ